MDKKLGNRSGGIGCLAFAVLLGVPALMPSIVGHNQELAGLVAAISMIIAAILFGVATMYLAMAKGRSPWWGLLGFGGSIIGILIVAVLKDYQKEEQESTEKNQMMQQMAEMQKEIEQLKKET